MTPAGSDRPAQAKLWLRLAEIAEFSLEVVEPGPNAEGVIHRGQGEIHAAADREGEIVWSEKGSWEAGPLAGIAFRNTTIWRLLPEDGAIDLSHRRRGGTPLHLVRLRPREAAGVVWVSDQPHRCGQDRYDATLALAPKMVTLRWTVESPSNPYQLTLRGTTLRSRDSVLPYRSRT